MTRIVGRERCQYFRSFSMFEYLSARTCLRPFTQCKRVLPRVVGDGVPLPRNLKKSIRPEVSDLVRGENNRTRIEVFRWTSGPGVRRIPPLSRSDGFWRTI